ncbi:MAG: hypothetical protein HZA90_05780 [Verrucomicrobia bacterium]|nr:hypothetical protein [Verrucomicrobiota bacterium]
MNPFQSLRDYERFVYTLQSRFPDLLSSTLIIQRRGRLFAELTGELLHRNGCRLLAYERLSWDAGPLHIVGYSYEVWHGAEKLYWYDCQPHPSEPTLASTHPHHKHLPPDLRHHRVPAPGLTFTAPNLPLLLQELASLRLGAA